MDKEQKLDLQMNVVDVLNEWPEVIPVFLRHQMACVGCSMSSFETLGSAAKIYGIVPETFLDELHQALTPPA